MRVLQAVEAVNEKQKAILFDKFIQYFKGDVKGKTVAMWGLAFKPETDDMREAPALVLIDRLLEVGCQVKVYDPIAMNECKRRIGDRVVYCQDMYEAVTDANGTITDVTVTYDEGYAEQMLRYGKDYSTLPSVNK